MKINSKYLIAFLILLITEIMIALFVTDKIIRPFIGDVLVVILIYTFIRALTRKLIFLLPLYIFLFATVVEIMQYFHIVNILNLQNNKLISTIIGTSFDIRDVLCYLSGAVILFVYQKLVKLYQ